MIDAGIRARCEQYGFETIRQDLAGPQKFFGNQADLEQAFEWMQEQHRLQARRVAATLWWARLGACAAVFAAIAPVFARFVKGF